MFRLLRLISYPQLRASWGRTALVVGGIATGVILLVGIDVINTTVLANFRRMIDLIAGPAALEVTLGVGEVGFSESTLDVIRAESDVVAAVPLVRGTIALADDSGEVLQLFGADLTAEEDLGRYQIVATTDRRELLRWMAEPHSILLTTAFATRHGLAVGDSIRLSTPEGIGAFSIRGLVETQGLAAIFGGRLAVMDLPAAQMLLGKPERLDQIDLVIRPGADVDLVQRRVQAALPSTLTVARPAQRGEQYERILASFQAMLTGLSTLCLVAGVFIVYNTTSTGAAHRAAVMASLRLIGADQWRLFRLLMLEALILGGVGALVGIPIGVALAQLLSGMVSESMGIIFQLRFPTPSLAVSGPHLGAIAAIGIAAALFACYFAARRVATLEPLDVIRGDVRTYGVQAATTRLVTLWVVLIAISVGALFAEQRLKSIAWGNFGATLWNASIIVIAVPLVGWLARALSRVLPRALGAEARMAVESLSRFAGRTGVTTAAIALVLTVAIMLSSLAFSFRESMNDYVGKFLAADLSISSVSTEGGWLETPLPERVVTELAALPGIRSIETGRALPGQIYQGQRIGILAVTDGLFDPDRYPAHWYHEGDPSKAAVELRAGRGANVSTGFADRFGVHVGDEIDLDTPTGSLKLPIVGVVPDYISDRGSVILSRRVFVDRWQDTTVSRINVYLREGWSADDVRSRIERAFQDRYRVKVLAPKDVLAYHADKINRAFAFTGAFQLLIVIVTVAGILDLLLSAIVERRRELALWRLIGADERAVRRSVVIESGTIGAFGAVLGVVVGLVTAWIWIGINFRYLLGYYLEYHLALGTSAWYVCLVLGMTMLAGFVAARRATREPILQGIQPE